MSKPRNTQPENGRQDLSALEADIPGGRETITKAAASAIDGKAPHPSLANPRDAASLIIYEMVGSDVFVLMGQRSARQVFMPNRHVFPGGRLDPSDIRLAETAEGLSDDNVRLVLHEMVGDATPTRANALAIAAVRETFEETGRIIGRPVTDADEHAPTTDPAVRLKSAPEPWPDFAHRGFVPDVSSLQFFARAITPPGEVRRYDTRFFAVNRTAIAAEIDVTDEELGSVAWQRLADIETLNAARITQLIARDFADALQASGEIAADRPVPFYYYSDTGFRRDLIAHATVN